MKHFDLFAGIGGFSLGIQNVLPETECVGFSEINQSATAIYRCHYKGIKNYGDIRTIRTSELPDFDLLTFGWPCQDNSIAGKRQGQKKCTRSGLLNESVRILRDKKPKYFVAENVKGLFSVNEGNDLYETIRLFTDTGYDVQWQLLNTRWFLPQNRERIYFVGHLRGTSRPKVFPIGEASGRNGNAIKMLMRNKRRRTGNRVFCPSGISQAVTTEQGGGRVMCVMDNGRPRRMTPKEYERLQGFSDDYTKYGLFCDKIKPISDSQRYKCIGNAVSVPVVEEIIKRLYRASIKPKPKEGNNERKTY